ncbi:MAG: hypothetical protein QM529_05835 [Hydrotalea sp.]|nr:hypothetical protein [Hydrotalea sp.]
MIKNYKSWFDDIRKQTYIDNAPIVRSTYNITANINGSNLEHHLQTMFGQSVKNYNDIKKLNNNDVLKAAVLSLASNMRAWRRIEPNKLQLEKIFYNYDIAEIKKNNHINDEEIRVLLGGQTGGRDAKSIISFLYNYLPKYKNFIEIIFSILERYNNYKLKNYEETIILSALLGSENQQDNYKIKGMGFALASEFLRNLGFPNFKPDRHILRIFYDDIIFKDGLCPDLINNTKKILNTLNKPYKNTPFEKRDKDGGLSINIETNIYACLLGAKIAEDAGCANNINFVDNTLWLYGSEIKKKKITTQQPKQIFNPVANNNAYQNTKAGFFDWLRTEGKPNGGPYEGSTPKDYTDWIEHITTKSDTLKNINPNLFNGDIYQKTINELGAMERIMEANKDSPFKSWLKSKIRNGYIQALGHYIRFREHIKP